MTLNVDSQEVESLDYATILQEIFEEVQPLFGLGTVANYIPALAAVDARKFGMAVVCLNGQEYTVGDASEPFSIQSISKAFTLVMALARTGPALWARVGLEPSGNPFNSLVQLEYERGVPRNPFINAGAMVVTDVLLDHLDEPKAAILDFIRMLADAPNIAYDEEVAFSEQLTGFRNVALVNFIKSHGNIRNDVDDILDTYFHQCAIRMSCQELARSFLFLANEGVVPYNRQRILTKSQAKRLNAILLTCGFYDQAGEFAYRVGMPGKSGVGGGITGVIPGHLAISVWSPELNSQGNSLVGIQALELFTTKTGLSVF